jgi:hypothetical protein
MFVAEYVLLYWSNIYICPAADTFIIATMYRTIGILSFLA